MIQLPQRIIIANNPTKQAFKYFIPIVVTFWITSFAFSGKIDHGLWVGFGTILLCVLTIVLVYKKDKKTKRTIELTNEGIVEIKKDGQTFIRWDENHQTYYDGTNFSYGGIVPIGTVVTTQVVAKGKRIRIDYPLAKFHETILAISHQHAFTLTQQQLDEGQKVYFGPIELEKEYIYLKTKQFSRNDIKKVKVENGKLILKMNNNWLSTKIMIRDVPNLSCLINLIEP